jgi:hypothetical protein
VRILIWIAGLWIGSLLGVMAQQPPSPPSGLPIAYPFAGSIGALSANGTGETLAVQDFGGVATGQHSQKLLTLNYGSPQNIVGVQYTIQPGSKADFAVFSAQTPLTTQTLPVMVEFRPKSAGQHTADVQVIGMVKGLPAVITHIPVTGTS